MPPFIPQRHRASTSPPFDTSRRKSSKKSRPSLFDTADKPNASATLQDNKAFLEQLNRSDSDSAFSGFSSDEFEDVITSPQPKRRKVAHAEEEDDDHVDWEDAIEPGKTTLTKPGPEPSGDLELTLNDGSQMDFSNALGRKKGPSKIERQIRIATHCMHVQFLLFHNLVRNGWACDEEVQSILVGQLPANVKKEVNRWRIASGMSPMAPTVVPSPRNKRRERRAAQSERNQRNWGKPAEKQEKGAPNMSRGDPLIRLLKILAAYWRKRWTITAPSLRKQGYKPLATLEHEIASYRKDNHNAEKHGECVSNIQQFRDLAKKGEGSRDIGAQLFTALVRGLGIEARLVASLQPVGFGWSKGEQASVKNRSSPKDMDIGRNEESSSQSDSELENGSHTKESRSFTKLTGKKDHLRGAKEAPISLSEESENSSAENCDSFDDGSIIDVTPSTPRKRPNMNYDRDMVFPTYWTESISSITNEVYPAEPFLLNPAVASNAEHLALFESRGLKADKARQVFAYIVGYSSDGTAKDVTTRYLKRHMWPGRTKGVRLPAEKVPVYSPQRKIERYEDYDWFKTAISCYNRTQTMRTAVDDLEEAKDLKAAKPEKKEKRENGDTLQGYKTSATFVLGRHLRREEAIKPGSKPVKTFAVGKGDKMKEEPVWLRKDVEVCRTAESWHKEGRVVKAGEAPMKMVPVRAVTLTRKREVEEAERDSGEKLKQGLYSWDQTDWIIPPPIKDGVIPKNAFGNIDCFVPTMVPKGAAHVPLRSTVRICKRLGIDYSEAVTGFEFGNKRAVPVITGVVVAVENETAVIEEWKKGEEERRIKEEGKREKAALATWRKWLMGLRIIQRVREEYGEDAEAHVKEGINPFTNQGKFRKLPQGDDLAAVKDGRVTGGHDHGGSGGGSGGGFLAGGDNMLGGGFLPEGDDEKKVVQGEVELTIEEGPPAKESSSIFRTAISRSDNEDNVHQSTSESEKPSVTLPMELQLLVNGTTSKKSKRSPVPNQAVTNSEKVRTSTRATGSGHQSVELAPSASKSRAVPKRHAARKSETAVKSHYLDHDSDHEEQESSGNVSAAEDMLANTRAMRKRKRGAPKGRRSLRAREVP